MVFDVCSVGIMLLIFVQNRAFCDLSLIPLTILKVKLDILKYEAV